MTNFILNYASLEAPPITWPPRQQLPTTCMQTNDQVHIQDYMEYVHGVDVFLALWDATDS